MALMMQKKLINNPIWYKRQFDSGVGYKGYSQIMLLTIICISFTIFNRKFFTIYKIASTFAVSIIKLSSYGNYRQIMEHGY